MKYPLKWGITYREKTYREVYGKKKAHDLLFALSRCLLNLSVVPVDPERKSGANKYNGKRDGTN